MRDITELYVEYKIMPLLAMHQLRVAAVAEIICDNLDIKIDKDSVIKACLLHDMGNIIKFDLNNYPEKNEPVDIDYWQGVRNEYIDKYGEDEHEASKKITKEIGVSPFVADLVKMVDSKMIKKIKEQGSFEEKICIYADNRVTPYHIVSLEERSEEAKQRYLGHKQLFDEEKRIIFLNDIKEIEKQIFFHMKINPEDINDQSISIYLNNLKNIFV